jgi:hypothetical protein
MRVSLSFAVILIILVLLLFPPDTEEEHESVELPNEIVITPQYNRIKILEVTDVDFLKVYIISIDSVEYILQENGGIYKLEDEDR